MKQQIRKVVSLLLALTMILSTMPLASATMVAHVIKSAVLEPNNTADIQYSAVGEALVVRNNIYDSDNLTSQVVYEAADGSFQLSEAQSGELYYTNVRGYVYSYNTYKYINIKTGEASLSTDAILQNREDPGIHPAYSATAGGMRYYRGTDFQVSSTDDSERTLAFEGVYDTAGEFSDSNYARVTSIEQVQIPADYVTNHTNIEPDSVTVNKNGSLVSFTITDHNLQSSYPCNQSFTPDSAVEHGWIITFGDGTYTFQIGTLYFAQANQTAANKTLPEMQSSLWVSDNTGHHNLLYANAELSISGTEITWSVDTDTIAPSQHAVDDAAVPADYKITPDNIAVTGATIDHKVAAGTSGSQAAPTTTVTQNVYQIINKSGDVVYTDDGSGVLATHYIWSEFHNDMLLVTEPDTYQKGYMDGTGTLVIPCVYADAYDFHNGYARVDSGHYSDENEGRSMSLIDTSGNTIIPEGTYDVITDVDSDGMLWAVSGNIVHHLKIVPVASGGGGAGGVSTAFVSVGNCGAEAGGETVTWALDSAGTLTISGTGAMANYGSSDVAPWFPWRGQITTVNIESGVTSIGDFAFSGCYALSIVNIAYGITSIGESAFLDCDGFAVRYSGTTAQWDTVNILDTGNDALKTAVIICSDSTPANWHFDEQTGVLTIDGQGYMPEDAEWKSYRSKIKSVIIESGIKIIVPYAFNDCENLESVSIPDTVISIGNGAFQACVSLTNITIPNSVTLIGSEAFRGCASLKRASLPASLQRLSYGVFWGCTQLSEIVIPNGLTGIDPFAFEAAAGLMSVTIPDSVSNISSGAFWGCSSLQNVIIPKNVNSISVDAFWGCASLAAITVASDNPNYSSENGVLFNKNKTALILYPAGKQGVTYTVPDTVEHISERAFRGCLNLTEIVIPQSVSYISGDAFWGCLSLADVTVNAENTQFTSNEGVLFDKPQTSLLYYPAAKSDVTYQIPASITYINRVAFQNCVSLQSIIVDESNPAYSSANGVLFTKDQSALVCYPAGKRQSTYTIPDTVTMLNEGSSDSLSYEYNNAFLNNTYLTSIVVGDSNTAFSSVDGVLYDKDQSVLLACPAGKTGTCTIQSGVGSVYYGAFANCAKLTSITIPASIRNLSYFTFATCRGLQSVNYGGSTEQWHEMMLKPFYYDGYPLQYYDFDYFNSYDFYSNKALGSAVIHCSDGDIQPSYTSDVYAYGNCGAAGIETSVQWELDRSGLLVISGNGAMADYAQGSSAPWAEYCNEIKTADIRSGITRIGSCAFDQCINLADVSIPDTVTTIGNNSFQLCSSLTSISFPNSLKTIEHSVFYGSGLTSVTVPDSVTRIDNSAFSGCGDLISAKLGNGIQKIDEYLFAEDSKLTSLTIPKNVTEIAANAFSYTGIKKFSVANGNTAFSAEDGVLYNAAKTSIVCYPPPRQCKLYYP